MHSLLIGFEGSLDELALELLEDVLTLDVDDSPDEAELAQLEELTLELLETSLEIELAAEEALLGSLEEASELDADDLPDEEEPASLDVPPLWLELESALPVDDAPEPSEELEALEAGGELLASLDAELEAAAKDPAPKEESDDAPSLEVLFAELDIVFSETSGKFSLGVLADLSAPMSELAAPQPDSTKAISIAASNASSLCPLRTI